MDTIKVLKIGGKVAEDEATLDRFLADFHLLKGSKILVHGGGVMATQLSEKMGIETQMIEGRRVTSTETLDVVTMVYGGLINKRLVAKLQAMGQNAIGLSGADLNIIHANKRNPVPIDFGWVGDVENVKSDWLKVFLEQGVVPVLAPLTHDGKGNMLNTNADNIAGFLAAELAKKYSVELIFCFDRSGVMNGEKVIPSINAASYEQLKNDGIISDGMIPKLDLGFQALRHSVDSVIIKGVQDLTIEQTGTQLKL
jgi:acetylglutamate kinase